MSEPTTGKRSSKSGSKKSSGTKGDSDSQAPPGSPAKTEPKSTPASLSGSNQDDEFDLDLKPMTDLKTNEPVSNPKPDSQRNEPSGDLPIIPLGLVGQPLQAPKNWADHLVPILSPFIGSYSRNAPQIKDVISSTEYASRIEDGLTLGEEYYRGSLLRVSHSRHPTRSEIRTSFREEYDMLNDFLTNVFQCPTESGNGYCIDRSLNCSAPRWGPYGSATDIWSANDFEVLAICYRHEVESFLSRILDARKEHETIVSNAGDLTRLGIKQELTGEMGEGRKEGASLKSPFTFKPSRELTSTPREEGATRNVALETPKSMRQPPSTTPKTDDPFGKKSRITYDTDTAEGRTIPPNFRTRMMSEDPFFRGAPAQTSSSRKFQELFGSPTDDRLSNTGSKNPFRRNAYRNHSEDEDHRNEPEHEGEGDNPPPSINRFNGRSGGGQPGDSSDSSSNDERRPNRDERRDPFRRARREGREFHRRSDVEDRFVQSTRSVPEPQFDTKLKVDIIPSWDGSPETLVRWITKSQGALQGAPKRGTSVFRFEPAKGLSSKSRNDELIELIIDKRLHQGDAHEMITEIMNGAPTIWTSVLTPHLFNKLVEFQHTLRFHEDHLLALNARVTRYDEPLPWKRDHGSRNPFESFKSVRTNLIGASNKLPAPPFPKDDNNVSKRKTPESLGVRPCRHCGSAKHWDNECKYARRAQKIARTNLAMAEEEDELANQEYDDAYFGLDSEDEGDQTGF
ncbi:hypothetical protein CC1G_15639 [Coprinopsis cinerea okayama7|uniref:Uncharacterized protein n=1 Tax=Coprinopsis cinerea (strain Okayama-7 / 130 / ATCC MYA-4618 / FGSC 9003) TaxID=240176 RepID=D6RQA2_COPC7|nr:hypothetical protein CC1G_15639 [Coprinopsis cinerea okayama7\|eukprot:XP_002910212.1 hypothetical protein CC1G_15639 [Coprinopsis cinerea okayama7\